MRKFAFIAAVFLLVAAAAAGGGYYYLHDQLYGRVEGAYYDSDGVRLHYTDEGQGDPVILIHGFTVNADVQWRRPGLHRALVKEFRVIAVDNRGHGLSGKPHDSAAYGTAFCEDIIGLMDHLGIERAAVAGYSIGGMITLKLLTLHPERFVCAAPCAYGWAELSPESAAPLEKLAASLDAEQGLMPLFELLTPLDRDAPDPDAAARMDAYLREINDQKALAAVVRSWGELVVTEEALRANTVPTLSIVGENDPLRADVDRMVGVMANHEVVYIPGTNHMNAITDEFIERLTAFIRDAYAAERAAETVPEAA